MHTGDLTLARQSAIKVYYYIFDLLFLEGYDLRNIALLERKKLLKRSIDFRDPLRFTSHEVNSGELFYKEACRQGWEGLIAKRAGSPYVSKRSRDWLKFKCVVGKEFVIGGYTEPQGARTGSGALLVGYYRGKRLQYAGKVGNGFDEQTLSELRQTLSKLETDQFSFEGEVREKGVRWVKPSLVAQVGFSQWTGEGKLRHPRFQGLRRDKRPQEVVRESKEI
jgi:DNA ligase D-like protein (predicted ligase)